jgi:hypothetical protein
VKQLQHRTSKCEDEARVYSQKLDETLLDFQKERSFFELMVSKVESTFVEIQSKIREEFDGLKSFVNLEMHLPLKKAMTLIDYHSEYLQQVTKELELLKRD